MAAMLGRACLLAAVAVLVLQAHVAAVPNTGAVAKTGRGTHFFSWLTEHLPELSLRLFSCLKQEQRTVHEVLVGLFADAGKCFDENKGSVLYTLECLLRNSVAHMISAITTTHKIINCAVKHVNDYRLCINLVKTDADGSCPFAIGI